MFRQLIAFLIALFVLPSALFAGDSTLSVGKGWSFTRTWKSAREGKYHFYSGDLPLRNISDKNIENLSARLRILDPQGKTITESENLHFGTLAPGKTESKKFILQPGVEFSELIVKAEFTVDGKAQSLEFSSPRGERPEPLVAGGDGVMEIRVLAHEITRKVIGKKKDKLSTLIVRLRNLSNVPATKPTAKIVFKVAKGSKTTTRERTSSRTTLKPDRPHRRSKKTDKEEKDDKKISTREETMSVVLDEGALPGGQTKTYTLQIDAPEYESYVLTASADWPAQETVVEQTVLETTAGGGDMPVVIGALEINTQEDGKATLAFPLTNNGPDLQAGQLQITISFTDKAGKEVANITYTHLEVFAKGATVDVGIQDQEVPAFASYSMNWSIASQSP